jgi:hypothetical protein
MECKDEGNVNRLKRVHPLWTRRHGWKGRAKRLFRDRIFKALFAQHQKYKANRNDRRWKASSGHLPIAAIKLQDRTSLSRSAKAATTMAEPVREFMNA